MRTGDHLIGCRLCPRSRQSRPNTSPPTRVFPRKPAEIGRWNAPSGRRLIGGSDFEENIFHAWLRPKDERERQAGLRYRGWDMRRFRNVAGAVRIKREHRIIYGGHVARRDQHLGETRVRTAERFGERLLGMSYWCGCPIKPGGQGVCSRTSASSLFSRITIMSVRRNSSRSMTRSSTPGGHRADYADPRCPPSF